MVPLIHAPDCGTRIGLLPPTLWDKSRGRDLHGGSIRNGVVPSARGLDAASA